MKKIIPDSIAFHPGYVLQCGNTHTDYIREILLKRREEIDVFDQDAKAYCLELY